MWCMNWILQIEQRQCFILPFQPKRVQTRGLTASQRSLAVKSDQVNKRVMVAFQDTSKFYGKINA